MAIMQFIRNQKSGYDICVRSGATDTERFAAEELHQYILRVTGARLPVRVFTRNTTDHPALIVGKPFCSAREVPDYCRPEWMRQKRKLHAAREGSFRLHTVGRNVWVMGCDDNGVINGAYAFIESVLGVRFWEPGRQGESVPSRDTLELPRLDCMEEPAFACRGAGSSGASSTTTSLIDWAAKNRLNMISLSPALFAPERGAWLREARKRGMKILCAGHISNWFFPDPKTWFTRHPEYYMLKDGTRNPANICYANVEAVRLFIDKVVAFVDEHPEIDILGLWPNDGNAFCQCNRCRRTTLGDQVYAINSVILDRLHKRHPRLRILQLSYQPGTLTPPSQPKVNRRMIILYCPYCNENKFHPVYDYRQGRKLWSLQDENANHRGICNHLRAWRRGHDDVMVFTYFNDQIMKSGAYSPYPDIIRDDVRYYHALGVTGLWDCLCYQELMWLDALNLRVYTRLAWNPEENLESLMADFYGRYYGAGCAAMAAFDRRYRHFWRLPLAHGWNVDDILWTSTCGDVIRAIARDYRPELDAFVRRQVGEEMRALRQALDDARRDARREPLAVRRRVERMPLLLENVARRFDMAYHNLRVAHTVLELERTKNSQARRLGISRLRALLREGKTIHCLYEMSGKRWKRRKEPGGTIITGKICAANRGLQKTHRRIFREWQTRLGN